MELLKWESGDADLLKQARETMERQIGHMVLLIGDPTRLAQVIGNLLTNACKHSESAGNIALTVERQQAEVKISVQDTGIGIPPGMLIKVFDMFTQIDKSLERFDGALGIGLALVKRLVELHGGTVTANNERLSHGS